MRTTFVLVQMAWVTAFLPSAFAATTSEPAIGYGSSTSVITDTIQEGFLTGFQLGIDDVRAKRSLGWSVLKEQVHDGSPLGAAVSARRLLDRGVLALFGFPGSTDALIAGRLAADNRVLLVVPGCNHPSLAAMGPSIYSTGHSGEREISIQLAFASRQLRLKRGLVVINPRAAPSAGMATVISSLRQQGRFPELEIHSAELDAGLKLSAEHIDALRRKRWEFILMTPYPEACKAVVEQFTSEGIDLPVIASSAWGTVDSDVRRRYVAEKKAPFFMLTSWLPDSESSGRFTTLFRRRFAKSPTADNAYGFDIGRIAALTLNRVQGIPSRKSVLSAFVDNPCFDGLSVGTLCFPKSGGHALRTVFVIQFTKQGFRKVAEFAP